MATTTIKSNAVIEYDSTLKDAQQARDAMFEMSETKSFITYRRYSLTNTNIVGDLNRQIYTDYQIYAIVMILLSDDRILQQGEMKPGDIELFLKPYINFEYDGTIIEDAFEPQIDDEVIFMNVRYRIKLLRAERIGNTKVFLDCLCSRIENDNPQVE